MRLQTHLPCIVSFLLLSFPSPRTRVSLGEPLASIAAGQFGFESRVEEMGEIAFEKYLFKKYEAVFVDGMSDTATDLNLLDVLIKTDSKGFFKPRPVLTKVGSLIELGTVDSKKLETVNKLREGLSRFEEGKGHELFKWEGELGTIQKTFCSAKSLTGSILAGPLAEASVFASHKKSLSITLEDLETACVNKEALVEMISENKDWKPDITNKRLQWSNLTKSGNKLWVVHRILYASKLVVTSAASAAAGARAVTAVPATPGAGIEASRDFGPNSLLLEVGKRSKFPGKFMFAYKALCFKFDSAGDLVDFEDNVGEALPVHRGEVDGPYDNERAQVQELFEVNPPELYSDSDDDEEEEWEGLPLPIEEC